MRSIDAILAGGLRAAARAADLINHQKAVRRAWETFEALRWLRSMASPSRDAASRGLLQPTPEALALEDVVFEQQDVWELVNSSKHDSFLVRRASQATHASRRMLFADTSFPPNILVRQERETVPDARFHAALCRFSAHSCRDSKHCPSASLGRLDGVLRITGTSPLAADADAKLHRKRCAWCLQLQYRTKLRPARVRLSLKFCVRVRALSSHRRFTAGIHCWRNTMRGSSTCAIGTLSAHSAAKGPHGSSESSLADAPIGFDAWADLSALGAANNVDTSQSCRGKARCVALRCVAFVPGSVSNFTKRCRGLRRLSALPSSLCASRRTYRGAPHCTPARSRRAASRARRSCVTATQPLRIAPATPSATSTSAMTRHRHARASVTRRTRSRMTTKPICRPHRAVAMHLLARRRRSPGVLRRTRPRRPVAIAGRSPLARRRRSPERPRPRLPRRRRSPGARRRPRPRLPVAVVVGVAALVAAAANAAVGRIGRQGESSSAARKRMSKVAGR